MIPNDKIEFKSTSKQTLKDREIIAQKIENNRMYYETMELVLELYLGGKYKKTDILDFAKKILKENNMKIERLMKRSKPYLICWFCEHMDLIPVIGSIVKSKSVKDPLLDSDWIDVEYYEYNYELL